MGIQERLTEAQQQLLEASQRLVQVTEIVEAKDDAGELDEWENDESVTAAVDGVEQIARFTQSYFVAVKKLLERIG